VAMLARGRGGRIAIELARNPLVVACVAGIAWKALGWPLPPIAAHVLLLLSGAALPLGLLAVGAGLAFARHTLPLPAIVWWNGVKLVALPAIAFALAPVLGLSPLERQIAVIMAAVPTAPSAYILAMQMNGHGAPVAMLVTTGTLLATVTLPIWLALAGG
jgi:malonate transporter